MRDLGRPDSASSSRGLYGDAAEHRFRASTQEIGERLLGRAMCNGVLALDVSPRHTTTGRS